MDKPCFFCVVRPVPFDNEQPLPLPTFSSCQEGPESPPPPHMFFRGQFVFVPFFWFSSTILVPMLRPQLFNFPSS